MKNYKIKKKEKIAERDGASTTSTTKRGLALEEKSKQCESNMRKSKISSLRTEREKMMMARATSLFNATPTEQSSKKMMMAAESYIIA